MTYHEDQLPELSPTPGRLNLGALKSLWDRYPLAENLALERGKLTFQPGDTKWMLGTKGLQMIGRLGELQAKGLLDFDGNWNLNTQLPAFGGLLGIDAGTQDGNDAYRLQYQRSFY